MNTTAATGAEPIRLVTGSDYAPFADSALPEGGLATHLLNQVFNSLEQPVTVDYRPWKRGYKESLDGKYDGTFPYIHSTERVQLFHYSEPLVEIRTYIFVKAGSPLSVTQPSDLHGKVFCNPIGYAPGILEDMQDSGDLVLMSPSTLEKCFQMLIKGRVDFLKSNQFVAPATMQRAAIPPGSVERLPKVMERRGIHLIMPKNNPKSPIHLQRIDAKIKAFRADGTWRRWIEGYLHLLGTPSG